MNSSLVLSGGHQDFFSMKKSEVSLSLMSFIDTEGTAEFSKSGIRMESSHQQLLHKAQEDLAAVSTDALSPLFVGLIMSIADKCLHLKMQQYAFTRIEEFLDQGVEISDKSQSRLMKYAKYFTTDGVHLIDGPFVRALENKEDLYLQNSAACGLGLLLTVCEGNTGALINWVNKKLSAEGSTWEKCLPALRILVRSDRARKQFIASGGLNNVVRLMDPKLKRSAQQIYDLSFIVWSLSLSADASHVETFLSAGTVVTLVEALANAGSRKVARMTVGALKNLAMMENFQILTEMFAVNLEKVLTNSAMGKNSNDVEFEADMKILQNILAKNYRDLTSFDRWASEVNAKNLRWGVVHSEKFWRENARFVEAKDFALLKALIDILQTSTDNTVISVALYDIGEFTRFYPNGRVVASKLGAKDLSMKLATDSTANADVQRLALQCVSKIMVTNWESMK